MIILFVVTVLFVYLLTSWLQMVFDSLTLNVRGPFPYPITGNGHLFFGGPSTFVKVLCGLAEKYDDIFRVYVQSERIVVLSHPKYVEPVLASYETITKGRSYELLHDWLGKGLVTSSGAKWKSHRKFLTPAFHYGILQSFLPAMLRNKNVLIEKLVGRGNGVSIDLFPVIAAAALDIITESIMGTSVDAQKDHNSDYITAVREMTRICAMRIQNPLMANDIIFKLSGSEKKYNEALKTIKAQSFMVIESRRQELINTGVTKLEESEAGMKNRYAFLDLLLLGQIDGNKLSNEDIREEVDTFMFAGHDTITSTIVFALHNLSKNKDVQYKILEEQKIIFGSDMDKEPSYSDLQQMKYLELVIKESMRLHPSVPVVERLLTQDMDIRGIRLKKNTLLYINIFHVHRHPDIFEDPLEFHPERFEKPLPSAFSWLPFSAGPRNCIGQKFAMMEIKVILSSIVKRFEILPTGMEPKLSCDLILKSTNDVQIKLRSRK